jgi:hypothetical protein
MTTQDAKKLAAFVKLSTIAAKPHPAMPMLLIAGVVSALKHAGLLDPREVVDALDRLQRIGHLPESLHIAAEQAKVFCDEELLMALFPADKAP